MRVWTCTLIPNPQYDQPEDGVLRKALSVASINTVGQAPATIFSGWGKPIGELEQAEYEGRDPDRQKIYEEHVLGLAKVLQVEPAQIHDALVRAGLPDEW